MDPLSVYIKLFAQSEYHNQVRRRKRCNARPEFGITPANHVLSEAEGARRRQGKK
jgi:hypothetical protein